MVEIVQTIGVYIAFVANKYILKRETKNSMLYAILVLTSAFVWTNINRCLIQEYFGNGFW